MTPSSPVQASEVDSSSPQTARASLERHRDLWATATVVGLGATARTVRELHILAHGLIRFLVDDLGFESIFVEGDWEASQRIDTFLHEGTGDPRAILAASVPYLDPTTTPPKSPVTT